MSEIPYSVRGGRGGSASASIETLTDTSISNLQNSQILKYNNVTSKWENTAESGVDLSAIPVNNILKKGDPAGNDFLDAEIKSQSISNPNQSGVNLEFIDNTQVRAAMKSFLDTSVLNQPREAITFKPSSLLNDDRVVTIVSNPPGVLPDNQKSYVGINKLRPINDLEVGTTLTVDDYTKRVGINTFPITNFDVLNTFYVNSDTRRVGILQSAPTKTLQVGTTMYVDEVTNRVGINNANPQHPLDVVGHIRLQSGGADRLIFNNTTAGDIADADAIVDGANGGIWGVRTKVDGGALTEKLRINNKGAIGIGGANYGNTNDVLTSRGNLLPPVWAPAPSSSPAVYGKCALTADQIASSVAADGGAIIAGWGAATWNQGVSVSGNGNNQVQVTQAGIYRFDLHMSTTRGGDIGSVEFHIQDATGAVLANSTLWTGQVSGGGTMNYYSEHIGGLLNIAATPANTLTNRSTLRVYGYQNGTNAQTTALWDAQRLNGSDACVFTLTKIA